MVATKNYLFLFIVLVLISFSVQAQQCGNCKEYPKIASFGFDIKVKEPNKEEGTENLWPEWKKLFTIASVISIQIADNEKGCIKMMAPPSVDTGNVELMSVGGETFVNLPSNPLISPDLSKYGNYLLTGSITNNGTNCQLNVEILTACSRKTVVTVQTNFSLSSVSGNVSQIARQVTAQLTPLAGKIKDFELKERQTAQELSLYHIVWEPIKITPQKKTLKTGESTSFTVEVKDCDGKPLAGREVLFSETTFDEMKIPGTIGGTVSPAKVVTDPNGIAKATFTLKAGAREAFIAAHSPGKDVKGCNSILFGDAPINIKYTYSGFVVYTYEANSQLTSNVDDNVMNNFFTGKETTSVSYRASFYSEGSTGSISLDISDEEESGTDIPDVLGSGSYKYNKSDYWKNTVICNCAGKGEVTEQKTKQTSAGNMKKSYINFSFDEGAAKISLGLFFDMTSTTSHEATRMASQSSSSQEDFHWPVDFDTILDKNFTVKKERVGNRTRYTGEGANQIKLSNGYQSTMIKIVVWEE